MRLTNQNNLVGDWRFFTGSLRDHSGRVNHATATSTHWQNGHLKAMIFDSSGRLDVADSAELQVTSLTLMPYSKTGFKTPTATEYVFAKKDGGGTNVTMYWDATKIYLYDGSTTSEITMAITGANSIAVTCASGSKPKFYKDSAYQGEGNNTLTITANDAPIKIGSDESNANQLKSALSGLLYWNTNIIDENVSFNHAWIMQQISPSYPKRNFTYPSKITGKESGLLGAWDMKNVHGKVIDKSGNGSDGTITGATQANGQLKTLSFQSGDLITLSGINLTDFNDTDWTVRGWLKTSTGQGIFGRAAGTPRLYITSTGVSYDDLAVASFDNVADNTWHRYVATYDQTNLTLYIDGVQSDQQPHVVESGFGATTLYIGFTASTTYTGEMSDMEVLNKSMSVTEVQQDYLKYASLPTFIDDLGDANVSIATEGGTVGTYLSNTNWKFGTAAARFKISTDEVDGDPFTKVIECTTAGTVFQESTQAYGTWEMDIYKLDATNPFIRFISDSYVASNFPTTPDNGYGLYLGTNEAVTIRETGNSFKFATAGAYIAINTWYKYRITRRYDGTFTGYIKGGAFKSWTLIDVSGGSGTNPVLDNSTTTSKYITLSLEAGDKIANFRFTEGVIDPT